MSSLSRCTRSCGGSPTPYVRREHAKSVQATELVHEAYLRLMKDKRQAWTNRAHFLAIAAISMRRLLVERARARGASKRGGARLQVTLDEALLAVVGRPTSTCSRSIARSTALARSRSATGAHRRAAVLRRPVGGRNRRDARYLTRHGQTALDRGQGLAAARTAAEAATRERRRSLVLRVGRDQRPVPSRARAAAGRARSVRQESGWRPPRDRQGGDLAAFIARARGDLHRAARRECGRADGARPAPTRWSASASVTTRSVACSAKAAWASSTWPTTRAWAVRSR